MTRIPVFLLLSGIRILFLLHFCMHYFLILFDLSYRVVTFDVIFVINGGFYEKIFLFIYLTLLI